MTYETHLIQNKAALAACPTFCVSHVQWQSTRAPKTVGRMAVLEDAGIYVTMASEERDPLTTLHSPMDMVCRDSAMEAFFAFPDEKVAPGQPFAPSDNGLYFNFEVNAAGAMYAKYGRGRKNRTALTPAQYSATGVWAKTTPTGWEMGLLLPFSLLSQVAGLSSFTPGDVFFCNFYKISENPAIAHYLSYSPIISETPNFHLPRFFARAVVVGPPRTT